MWGSLILVGCYRAFCRCRNIWRIWVKIKAGCFSGCICQNWWIYLSKLINVFVQIVNLICPNWTMYVSTFVKAGDLWKFGEIVSSSQNVFSQNVNCICQIWWMNLSKFINVFVKLNKCICQNCTLHLSKLKHVFVHIKFFKVKAGDLWKIREIVSSSQNVFAQN